MMTLLVLHAAVSVAAAAELAAVAPASAAAAPAAAAAAPAAAAAAAAAPTAAAAPAASTAPRLILMVIVDDLGRGDVGFTYPPLPPNPEVFTPHMDALAGSGTVIQRHYVHKMCTPSRASFLTGRLPMHVQDTLDNPEVSAAGVPYNMSSIAQVLKRGGFSTAMVGKQDQGMATETHTPRGRGFDQSLIYLFVVIHAHTGAGIIAPTLCTLVENLPPSPPPFPLQRAQERLLRSDADAVRLPGVQSDR
jgi:arylsulfatase A-like enzyme